MIENQYFHISPLLLVTSEQQFDFKIYLFQDNNYILYATPTNFTEEHRKRLVDNGIGNIYINNKDKMKYESFVQKNLHVLLDNPKISLDSKVEILYDHSMIVVEKFFNQISKDYPNSDSYEKLVQVVDNIYRLFNNNQGAIQSLRNLIATNYKEYVHCINTSLYAISLLIHHHREQSDPQVLRKSTVRQIGVGALLHDIGKSKVRQSILEKFGVLTPKEFDEVKKHPIHGVEMCQYMDLDQSVAQCVLFHHEKLDGSGYPTGTRNIPRHVQVITIADMYDAITCERPYRKYKITSFEALRILSKDVERGRLDRELVTSFIRMISQGGIQL
ncbi:HD-GYP domain-containing protein [Desulfonatronum thiodismutans]|uniref:HD-GYP domain-containing protein n=1 Tax=Desulfonatronum thiodismutans TaxID=159290 RepID=UPI0004ABD473|nr:HD domain-containing phosphohydrolase [Desulfonatronum thiodismutans]